MIEPVKPVIIETTRILENYGGVGVHLPKGYRHMVTIELAERKVKTGEWKYSNHKTTQEQIEVVEHAAQKEIKTPAVVNHNYIINESPNEAEPELEPKPARLSKSSKGVRDTC